MEYLFLMRTFQQQTMALYYQVGLSNNLQTDIALGAHGMRYCDEGEAT